MFQVVWFIILTFLWWPIVHRSFVRACINNFFKQHLLWNHLLDFDQTLQEWSLGGPLSKLFKPFQLVALGRSRGQKIGFAIFKNLLVRNYKAQSFHIMYIASSRGPLPNLFKLCPWGQNWPRPGGHNFTLIYIRKTLNNIFSLTANGNLTKLHRNDPWVVPYQSCSNRSSWLHK